VPKDTLVISVVRATIFRETEEIGHMDPYVEITIGTQDKKTHTVNEGGHVVAFHEEMTFDLKDIKEKDRAEEPVSV
jgi:hypothetical protein